MNFNFIPLIAVWGVLALVVLGLYLWRRNVAKDEDDGLHVLHGVLAQQTAVAEKLDMIDKWGKILTALAAISGLLLAAAYLYQQFVGRAAL